MFKLALIATVTAASTFAAAADPAIDLTRLPTEVALQVAELQTYGDRYQPAIDAILLEARMKDYRWDGAAQGSAMAPEVAERVADLQSYGTRFQGAIIAILREATMADYRWETDPTDPNTVVALAPES